MQLQQLRYLIAAAEEGSFRAAASKLFVSQSSISVAIKDLENEMGVTVFERTPRGTTLTAEGEELVQHARNIILQADIMEQRYARTARTDRKRLTISSQHYSFVVDALADLAIKYADENCDLALRESHTDEIIRDVREHRSNLGVIYLSNYNESVMKRVLEEAGLDFVSLYTAQPHALVGSEHPIAHKTTVSLDDLEAYYHIEQEQGVEASSFFAEEPLAAAPTSRRITVSDNGTMGTLLARNVGYALGTGAFRSEGDVVSIPIETDEIMNVGYIIPKSYHLSDLANEFLNLLAKRITTFEGPITASAATLDLAEEA